MTRRHSLFVVIGSLCPALLFGQEFRFVLLGDRTGEAQPGVYEQVWKQIASEKPAFVAGAGDSIEGTNEAAADDQWRQFKQILKPFSRYPLYLVPGNHDVWSAVSERLYQQYSGHPLHYSFDYENAHFTMLDNSRSDPLPPGELAFLESDLKAHAAQPVKFVISHRPFWLLDVAVHNPDFPMRRLAKQYGVQYVIAGHVHQMLHLELDGVTYLSLPSAGGHLRLSGAYEDGWLFGYIVVAIQGKNADFQVKELTAPRGRGRVTKLMDWGMTGLIRK